MIPYSRIDCVHYVASYTECRAGISPESLLDDEERTPCVIIRNLTGKRSCALRSMPKVTSREFGAMATALDAFLSGRCPKCNTKIEAEMEFNDNTLAMPCRHVIRSAKEA